MNRLPDSFDLNPNEFEVAFEAKVKAVKYVESLIDTWQR